RLPGGPGARESFRIVEGPRDANTQPAINTIGSRDQYLRRTSPCAADALRPLPPLAVAADGARLARPLLDQRAGLPVVDPRSARHERDLLVRLHSDLPPQRR